MFYQANLKLLEYQQTLFREKKNPDSYFSDWLFDLMNKLLEVRILTRILPVFLTSALAQDHRMSKILGEHVKKYGLLKIKLL